MRALSEPFLHLCSDRFVNDRNQALVLSSLAIDLERSFS